MGLLRRSRFNNRQHGCFIYVLPHLHDFRVGFTPLPLHFIGALGIEIRTEVLCHLHAGSLTALITERQFRDLAEEAKVWVFLLESLQAVEIQRVAPYLRGRVLIHQSVRGEDLQLVDCIRHPCHDARLDRREVAEQQISARRRDQHAADARRKYLHGILLEPHLDNVDLALAE